MLFMLFLFSKSDLLADDSDLGGGGLLLDPRLFDESAEILGGTVHVRYLLVDLDEDIGYAVHGEDRHQVLNRAHRRLPLSRVVELAEKVFEVPTWA